MRVLVFDVCGKLGHFRKFYTTSSSLTYPFPTPTALRGLIGAIVGYGKNEYLEKTRDISLAVQILSPVKTIMMSVNYINTKEGSGGRKFVFLEKEKKSKGDKSEKSKSEKDVRTQAIIQFLKDPKYRIFVVDNGKSETFEKLKKHLENREFVYTPVLGTSEHLAEINYFGTFTAEILENYEGECHTVCPIDNIEIDIVPIKIGKELIPYDMENDRSKPKYLEVLYSKEPYKPIRGKYKKILKVNFLNVFISPIPPPYNSP
ncbi:type I-B CRISPR-associated protein Cas5b [Candidatus Caldipriscus sp.]|nr:type I-B CRISPR-associated protein Cas5b [Candidatus Caldipriscus sp.]